jgi:flagellar biosynthesis activator protein FlaF
MYEFAYNDIIDESPKAMRAQEKMALERVIVLLREAQAAGPGAVQTANALYQLRRLWSVFLEDLANPDNALPERLRAGIISIGIWVNREIDRLRTGVTTDLSPLIEINEIIRDGLN